MLGLVLEPARQRTVMDQGMRRQWLASQAQADSLTSSLQQAGGFAESHGR